ncbi:hypothetical protein JQX13_21270 [Archangium violaceum]|uniref:hypothetical protein n=1 Tax=Archangium violaceum TaxID=83451 RepID=UPI00193B3121|nr:hypothetical protein [Archangium violaceum]QRK12330.1 hypothetical protein JQX13_21270 [Archangium violaceum]
MRFGSYGWRLEGTRLTIRRERGAREIGLGVLGLLLATGIGLVMRWATLDVQGLLLLVLSASYGVKQLLSVWRVTLYGEARRVVSTWGLGVPLVRRTKGLGEFERVEVITPASRPEGRESFSRCEVRLAGAGASPLRLADGNDEGEALALAEAVARLAILPLRVDEGRARPLDESQAAAPAQALAASSAEPEVPRSLPGDSRIVVRQEGNQLVVELPAPGWTGGFLPQAIAGGVLVAVTLGFFTYAFWHRAALSSVMGAMLMLPLMTGGMGGFFLWTAWTGATAAWRITASRPGLELVRFGSGEARPTRIPLEHIRDVDVRLHSEGGPRVGVSSEPTSPMLIIDRTQGGLVALGVGLPREELEWVADRLRQVLAEVRRQRTG